MDKSSQSFPIMVVVNNHDPNELRVLQHLGFTIIHIDEQQVQARRVTDLHLPILTEGTEGILRSPRLSSETYLYLYDLLVQHGIRLVNTPAMSERASEFRLHYPFIAKATPQSIVLPADASASELVREIQRAGLHAPLFMKTETKSLKGESVVTRADLESVDSVRRKLTERLAGFRDIVVKELVPLRSSPADPATSIEYRAFVAHGKIACFDAPPEGMRMPPIEESAAPSFYDEWVSRLRDADFCNFYIMDVAMLAGSDDFMIVEIKDAQFTRPRDPNGLWTGMRRVVRLQ